jgi:phosphoribosylformylglycinamidine cyclo-ligase
MTEKHYNYAQAGVDSNKEELALRGLLKWVNKSHLLRTEIGSPKLKIGFFANVIDIGEGFGLAISTDSVGTKILVAQMMNKYDAIGIDCVAMNVFNMGIGFCIIIPQGK